MTMTSTNTGGSAESRSIFKSAATNSLEHISYVSSDDSSDSGYFSHEGYGNGDDEDNYSSNTMQMSYLDDLFLNSSVGLAPSNNKHNSYNSHSSHDIHNSNNDRFRSRSGSSDVRELYQIAAATSTVTTGDNYYENDNDEFTLTSLRKKRAGSSDVYGYDNNNLQRLNHTGSVSDDKNTVNNTGNGTCNSNEEQEKKLEITLNINEEMKAVESYLKHRHKMRQSVVDTISNSMIAGSSEHETEEDTNDNTNNIFNGNSTKLEDHRLYYHINFANPISMKRTFLYCLQTDDVELTKQILRDVSIEYLLRHCMHYNGVCHESVAIACNGAMEKQPSSLKISISSKTAASATDSIRNLEISADTLNYYSETTQHNIGSTILDNNNNKSANIFWLASLYGSAQVLELILEATWVHFAETYIHTNFDKKYLQENDINYQQIEENSKKELTRILNGSAPSYGITPLYIAAAKNHKDIILILLKYGVDPNKPNDEGLGGTAPALIAAARDNTEALEGLATSKLTNFNQKNERNITPLLAGCRNGSINAVRYLTNLRKDGSNKALINCQCQNTLGYGCASVAAQHNQCDIISYLCQIHDPENNGVDINQRNADKDGDTAFLTAVRFHRCSVVKTLMEMIPRTCDVMAVNNVGMNAVHIAAYLGYSQIIHDLMQCLPLEAFSEYDVEDKMGMTPIFYATLRGYDDIVKKIAPLSDIHTLRRVQMSPKKKRVKSTTTTKGKVDDKQNTNRKIYSYQTPLHTAALSGNMDIIYTLIHCGADVNVVDSGGHTALSLAAKMGHLNVVRILVDSGADTKIKSKRGKTPFQKAKKYKRLDVVEFLELRGSNGK